MLFTTLMDKIKTDHKLTDSTITRLKQTILHLSDSMPDDKCEVINKRLLAKLDSKMKGLAITSQSTYYSHVLKYLKAQGVECEAIGKKYKAVFDEQKLAFTRGDGSRGSSGSGGNINSVNSVNSINSINNNQQPTKSWLDIVNDRVNIETKLMTQQEIKRSDKIDLLVASLYTLIPPLRGSEYVDCMLAGTITDSERAKILSKCNLCVLSEGKFYFTHYKTAKKYGLRTVSIPAVILPTLEYFVEKKPIPLLPFSTETLRLRLNKIFGVSSRLLRRIYVSYKLPSLEPHERAKLANLMAHSYTMQSVIYARIPTTNTVNDTWQEKAVELEKTWLLDVKQIDDFANISGE